MVRMFHKDASGSILPLVAVGLAVILAVSALAIDITRYMGAKSKFEHAVDQSLLAAASVSSRMTPAQMSEEAQKFFHANFPTSYGGVLNLTDMTVTFDPSTYEWQGTAHATITPAFGKLVGVNSLPIAHTAKVVWDMTSVEAVFVVDNSAHMCAKTTYDDKGNITNQTDDGCAKLGAVKYALSYLIGGDTTGQTGWAGLPALTAPDGTPAYRIGIVPFTHKVKMPDLTNIPAALDNAETTQGDPNYFTSFTTDPGATETAQYPLPPVTPLVALTSEGDRQNLLKAVNNLSTYYTVPGWTRSSIGLLTGALMLDSNYNSYFANGYNFNGVTTKAAPTSDIGATHNDKIIFLLTDGANMGCCFSSQPNPDPATGNPNYANQYLYSYRTDDQYLTGNPSTSTDGLCGQLKQNHIQVYTVVYDVNQQADLGGGATITGIMQNCASGPQNVNFFNVASGDKAALTKAYSMIAQGLMRLRLTY
ncbi:MAG: pilus assembly protein TadG-related protein [Alphaproteobacteria bacterium]